MNPFGALLDPRSILNKIDGEYPLRHIRPVSSGEVVNRPFKQEWIIPELGTVKRSEVSQLFGLSDNQMYALVTKFNINKSLKVWPVLLWMYVHQNEKLRAVVSAPRLSAFEMVAIRTKYGLIPEDIALITCFSKRHIDNFEGGLKRITALAEYQIFCGLIDRWPEMTFRVALNSSSAQLRSQDEQARLRFLRSKLLSGTRGR